jgi:hypothetical protein
LYLYHPIIQSLVEGRKQRIRIGYSYDDIYWDGNIYTNDDHDINYSAVDHE